VRKAILLAMGGVVFLAGCGPEAKDAPGIPVGPKWKGPAYRLAFDTKPPKPKPAGISIPDIKFTANPDALERRATLVIHYDSSEVKSNNLIINQVILAPFDITGAEGALSPDTMDTADKDLAKLLSAYCMKDKVKVSVLLARSSLAPQADDAEINDKRLSDWQAVELPYKNVKKGCPK
jgi:hypothetical protein